MTNNTLYSLDKPPVLHDRIVEAAARKPRYTAEQVARRRKVANAIVGVGAVAAVAAGVAKVSHSTPTEMVDAKIVFGQSGSYSGVAESIDRKFEAEKLNEFDIVDDMKAARSADLAKQGRAGDISNVFQSETITIQVPRTAETDAVMDQGKPVDLGELGTISFSPVEPPANQ